MKIGRKQAAGNRAYSGSHEVTLTAVVCGPEDVAREPDLRNRGIEVKVELRIKYEYVKKQAKEITSNRVMI